jgi:hypothetical protein
MLSHSFVIVSSKFKIALATIAQAASSACPSLASLADSPMRSESSTDFRLMGNERET